jgi:sulfur carrier protein
MGIVRVNNRDEIEWEPGLTVTELLRRFRYTFPAIVVTINGEVIPEEEFAARQIPDGADVRVIHLIAGG